MNEGDVRAPTLTVPVQVRFEESTVTSLKKLAAVRTGGNVSMLIRELVRAQLALEDPS